MFNGIRSRLLVSYLLLIGVTLATSAAAFLFFLSTRPAPPEQTYRELLLFVRTLDVRQLTPNRPLRGDTTLRDSLVEYGTEAGYRVLFVRSDRMIVSTDSNESFVAGDQLVINENLGSLLPRDRERFAPFDYTVGSFRDVDNSEWLFVGLGGRPGGDRRIPIVLIATPRPSTTLLAVISEFGNELGTAIIQSAIIGLIAAIIMAVLITRSFTRPLRRLSIAASAVANGDYQQRVPEHGPQEMLDVAQAFNRMSKQVELNNQAQRDLLANVSHDLKTPLTSIQGYAQAITDGTASNPDRAATIIFDEAGRLTRLVNQLTELARLRAGRLTMRQDSIDMALLVDAMVQKIDVMAQQKNIKIHTNITPVPPVKGDGDRLAQVVNNLLSNAVKYTPDGGQVLTAVKPNGNGVYITVKDSGIGIEESDISRIFERFYQVDKTRGPQRGHGLGLAITHEIVEAHGGKIQVKSSGRDKGSQFMVWLPLNGDSAA